MPRKVIKHTYFVEHTDTFGGEANYSWVNRYKVTSTTPRGAAQLVGKHTGLAWRMNADYGDTVRFDSTSGATCLFVSPWEEQAHADTTHTVL